MEKEPHYRVYNDPYDINAKCCNNCIHFQERTHFCRLNPPSPVVVYDKETRGEKITSKFPVITMPQSDYCAGFEADGNK